jgi:hypothetical protein
MDACQVEAGLSTPYLHWLRTKGENIQKVKRRWTK